MIQKILETVIDAMVPYLEAEQLEKLNNVLYINFHNIEVQEVCYELQPTGLSGNAAKIQMFVASKKAVNRQDNTLRGYVREIKSVLDFLGKDVEDITGMDLRYYYGVMRERRHIKMSTM